MKCEKAEKIRRQKFLEWLTEAEATTATIHLLCDPATHVPTLGELNNLTYMTCKMVGWPMRQADLAMISITGGHPLSVDDISRGYIPAMAAYIWDHILGEPEWPTTKEITRIAKIVRHQLYGMDFDVRNSIESVSFGGNHESRRESKSKKETKQEKS